VPLCPVLLEKFSLLCVSASKKLFCFICIKKYPFTIRMHCCVYCKRMSFDEICVCIVTACHWIRTTEIANSPTKCWTLLQGLSKIPSPYFFLWKYITSKIIQLFKIMHERTRVNHSVICYFSNMKKTKVIKVFFDIPV